MVDANIWRQFIQSRRAARVFTLL